MRFSTRYCRRGTAGIGSAVLAASLCLMFPLSGFAQDPFQSAPAPAPVVRPAPPTRLLPPRPQRPTYRAEPEPVTATPPPAPATPVVQTPPPEPPPLAGVWDYQESGCRFNTPGELHVTPSAREQYSINGKGFALVTGWISGTAVHFEGSDFFNRFIYAGTVDSPTTMRGKIIIPNEGRECGWRARKR